MCLPLLTLILRCYHQKEKNYLNIKRSKNIYKTLKLE